MHLILAEKILSFRCFEKSKAPDFYMHVAYRISQRLQKLSKIVGTFS